MEKQLAAAEAKWEDPEKFLVETNARQNRQRAEAVQLVKAKQALQKGDITAAKRIFDNVLQSGNQNSADASFQLGELAYDGIDYAMAHQYYLKAARLQPKNTSYLNSAGIISLDLGRYQEALSFLKKALVLREKSLGPEDLGVATSLNGLAMFYKTQGDYVKAESLLQRALKIVEKSLGLEHSHVATVLEHYASLLGKTGRAKEASQLAIRAEAIRAKSEHATVPIDAKESKQSPLQR